MASLIGNALLLVLACALSAAHALRVTPPLTGVVGVHEWRGGQLATMTATESDEDLSKLTKKVLKERLQTLGLRVSGKKRVLIERLEQHIASNANAPGKHRKPHSTPGQTLHAVIMLRRRNAMKHEDHKDHMTHGHSAMAADPCAMITHPS